MDPEYLRIGRHFHIIDGSIDHRGNQIKDLDKEQLEMAAASCRERGAKVYAAVSKFSTRNPAHENAIAEKIGDKADFSDQGPFLSGILNFPRRVATACFNSSVWRMYNDFAWAVEESVKEYGLTADVHVLKADGGTMPLGVSMDYPVESILSGPAASVMGIIALCDVSRDSIILDVGGTTTDIAVFADGAPIMALDGKVVGSYPTLVRALKIKSIGIGGDSSLHVSGRRVTVGPDRQGPCLASGQAGPGCPPTLTDALNYLKIADFGDPANSQRGIRRLAERNGSEADKLAGQALDYAVSQIREAALDLVFDINEKPVYTIHELLEGKQIKPERVYVMGGPAKALAASLEKAFGLPVIVPEYYAVANAIGAALTRTTLDLELFADTQKKILFVPKLGIQEKIEKNYNIERAKDDARKYLTDHLRNLGVDLDGIEPDITEAESFNMVDGPVATGKNIRVKCQVRPGIVKGIVTAMGRRPDNE